VVVVTFLGEVRPMYRWFAYIGFMQNYYWQEIKVCSQGTIL
jgi:hypothetical protein